MKTAFKGVVLLALVMLTVASQTDVKRDELDNSDGTDLDPLQNADQDFSEKDHSKRTFGSTTYDSYGLAKHIKIKGGQKLVLGYTPVDLKYVPVIRPWRNGWRFRQRPVARPKPVLHLPKPDTNGWKPLLHVPPPQPSHGWTKPGAAALEPIRPSAPDYHHDHDHDHDHDQIPSHHHHEHDDHHHHIVHDHHPVVPVVQTVHTVPVDHYDGHFDLVHHRPHPQVVYYNPLPHVARPALPVLPLGAAFDVPVGTAVAPQPALAAAPVAPVAPATPVPLPTAHYHPQYQFVHSVPVARPHLNVVHEVPAPHFHPTSVPFAPIPTTPVAVPTYYDHHLHHHQHNVHAHVPQVYEYHLDIPQQQPVPATPVVPVTSPPVEYHGHVAHVINTPYQNHHHHNVQQYVPENYSPHILPGSTGTLSTGFLNPGYTDLQIPEHLPDHPAYNGAADSYYPDRVSPLPEGVVQPQLALEPPINK